MKTYSNSSLEAYEICPLKFKYKYVDRVKIEVVESIEAFLGNTVHKVLERLYRELNYSRLLSLEEVVEYYKYLWGKNWHENIEIVKKELGKEHYYNSGIKQLADYYKTYFPFDQAKTIALEQEIGFKLSENTDYKVKGYVDRISFRANGVYEVHDYKTSSFLPNLAEIENNRQLSFYHLGVKNKWKDADDIELFLHYLAFNKEIKTKRSEDLLAKIKTETLELISEIENAEEKVLFPPKVSAFCNWCEFQRICPMWKQLYK